METLVVPKKKFCYGKLRYKSFKVAKRWAKFYGRLHKGSLWVYQCTFCGFFHLTSSHQKKKKHD